MTRPVLLPMPPDPLGEGEKTELPRPCILPTLQGRRGASQDTEGPLLGGPDHGHVPHNPPVFSRKITIYVPAN